MQRVTCGILSSILLFEPPATGLSPRPARHEEGVRRAVNYSPAAPTCSASPRMLPRGSPPASQERDDVAREIMLLPLVGHGSRRRAPRRTCNGAPALAAPRAQYAPRAAPGGCPLPRVPFLEPQRGSYVNPALPSSRARGLEYSYTAVHARAATVHSPCACGMLVPDVLPLLC